MGRLIAVASGKGGVGKSVVVAGLGTSLARGGCRVVVADLDVGGANLATLFGAFEAAPGLDAFWKDRRRPLVSLLHPVSPRLHLLAGGGETLATANPTYGAKHRLLRELRRLDADLVILDLGAGTGLHALDFFLAAEFQILVAIPEPASVVDAYRFVKLAAARALLRATSPRSPARRELARLDATEVGDLVRVWRRTEGAPDGFVGGSGREALARLRPELLVNRGGGREALIARLRETVLRYLGRELPLLGAIPEDVRVGQATRSFLPVTDAFPRAPASVALQLVATAVQRRLRLGAAARPPTFASP